MSSDSGGLYRGSSNGVQSVGSGGVMYLPSLAINGFRDEQSDFMVAEVIIFNSQLTLTQITTIENYLIDQYGT